MKQDDPRLVFWSEDQWLASKGKVQAIHDSYWLADEQGRIVLYMVGKDMYPQCNRDLRVAEHIRDRMSPWAQVIQVPLVLVPVI